MDFKKRLLVEIGIPVAVLILILIGIFFVGSDIADKAQKIESQRSDIAARLEIANSLTSLKNDSEQIKNYQFALENILPSRDKLILFPRDISAMGKQYNLDINIALGQGTAGTENNPWSTSFRIAGAGKFNDFLTFLKSLNSGKYTTSFSELDFVKEGDNFRASLAGQVFSL